MSQPPDAPSPRRSFLGTVAGAAAALAATSILTPELRAAVPTTTRLPQPPSDWDMSWVGRIKGPHRQVVDSPEVAEGNALHIIHGWLSGFAEVYGTTDKDMSGVIVFRHVAVPMVTDDVIWDKYELGKGMKLKDPDTGKSARRNPFLNSNAKKDSRYSMIWPDGGVDTLLARGQTVLACNMALRSMAGGIAHKTKQKSKVVLEELKAHLVPGVLLMPSGIFAVTRAEEAGCRFMVAG